MIIKPLAVWAHHFKLILFLLLNFSLFLEVWFLDFVFENYDLAYDDTS